MTTTAATALDRLAAVHPHHVERITAHNDALFAGSVATVLGTASGTSTNRFFTGIAVGDHVRVSGFNAGFRSLQNIDGDSAHLSASTVEIVPVPLADWTIEEACAAKDAAEKAALSAMERALCSANGLLGAPAGDEAALAALREAHDLRLYAFACQVYRDYLLGL